MNELITIAGTVILEYSTDKEFHIQEKKTPANGNGTAMPTEKVLRALGGAK